MLKLVRQRNCWVPTWRGWLLLLVLLAGFVFCFIGSLYRFLAVQDPVHSDILVVEGWVDDNVFEEAVREFKHDGYRVLVTTGGPIEKGSFLSEYKNYAEVGLATVKKLGLDDHNAVAVPAPEVRTDRTYAAAGAFREWLRQHYPQARSVQVVSHSAHARRTRLLYEKALGSGVAVGIQAIDDTYFNGRDWWRCSKGVRIVSDEFIAYLYARFLFHPQREMALTHEPLRKPALTQ